MHLEEKTISSQTIYEGKIISVYKDTVELENGEPAFRELVCHDGGVCVVPLTDENEVYFVKQFRYPYKKVLLEIPAGKLEKGEDHRDTGLRELKEEIGAECESFEYLGVIYPSVAYLSEQIHIYIARGLSFSEQDLDEDEFLDIEKIKLTDALEMVMNNEINDSKTVVALLKTARLLNI